MSDTAIPIKKTTRRKSSTATATVESLVVSATPKNVKVVSELFAELLDTISEDKVSFDKLQKEILDIREFWIKEQVHHETEVKEKDQQEALDRRREKEAYEYETTRVRKQAEDEFTEKKAKWERELATRKEEIEKDKKELELLRKQAEGFEGQLDKAVKEAREVLQKEITGQFATEKKLREQEVKAEKDLLIQKIQNITVDNERQTKEITSLKTALEDASRQLKDVAVKVIESSSPSSKTPSPAES